MIRFLVILFFFVLCSFSYSTKYEKIYSFHSDIQIQADGSVLVTEKIEVLALGRNIKKGIYRDIPLNFHLPEGIARQSLTVQDVVRDGAPEPYKTDMIEGGIRIYIGSSNENVPEGKHTYELTYLLDRTVYCEEDYCEVMWNVNGNQWEMIIDTLSATITTPENADILDFDGWTGRYGESDKKNFVTYSPSSEKRVFMTDKLNPGNNLTVAIVFDKNVMSEVSFTTRMLYFFRDNSLLIIGVFGFIITFIINLILWMKHGKDPKKGTIIPQYYAPEGWSPAEVLYLLNDGKEDDNMFAAQLLQLAVKGHIKIEKKDSKSGKDIFVISHADKDSKKQSLTDLEEGFMNKLLGDKAYTIIQDKYNPRVSLANQYLISRIEKNQSGVYFRKNKGLFLAQYLVPITTVIGMVVAINFYEGPIWWIFLTIVLLIIMNSIFMRLFYQPTMKGRKMLDHILGLERFIKYADELRIKATNKPDMNFDFFERNLPYAIAFGKADEWGKKFRAQDIEARYQSSNYYVRGYAFHHLAYIGALSAAASSASVPPSSTGSSGGGFSGGGFSGGGAGGGGGGGW
jgi:uncharacterized membrane protein